MTISRTARAWQQFAEQTTTHQLTVLHDDGLYRHLRMAAPGTRIWSWDVITWPGHLATAGDIADGFTFSRLLDMLNFFGPVRFDQGVPEINPGYWAEKLPEHQRAATRRYSRDQFLEYIDQTTQEAVDGRWMTEGERAEFLAEAGEVDDDHRAATDWLDTDFRRVDADWWEADLKDWDHHFLLTCFAIVTTIRAYREETSRERSA